MHKVIFLTFTSVTLGSRSDVVSNDTRRPAHTALVLYPAGKDLDAIRLLDTPRQEASGAYSALFETRTPSWSSLLRTSLQYKSRKSASF